MNDLWRRANPGEQVYLGEPCQEWHGYIDPDGYGHITVAGEVRGVHRVAYERAVGAIPEGLEIDHLCRNRRCINPRHLEAVPRRINVLRGTSFAGMNAALTHCSHGHEFTPENTRIHRYPTHTKRICRACDARRQREMKARRAA